jgi:murein DD-endopeptidase MepM/ murein hydrolase activator NlpD
MDEAQPAATVPFLYQPSTVPLTGRGYFDHAFPTVDFGGWPNSAGMLDYLGRTNTNYDTHDGDDLWMPFGSPVVAPVNGTVLWVDTIGPDYGLLIRAPDSTYDIVLVHLSDLWVARNSIVTRGQLIGRSGQAGATRRIPHIHFEVRHNGRQTDTRGWYGSGVDPCPAGGSGGGYSGCEASVWLWADEAPPSGDDPAPTPLQPRGNSTPTPLPSCTSAPVVPTPRVSPRSAARVLLPFVINAADSCRLR